MSSKRKKQIIALIVFKLQNGISHKGLMKKGKGLKLEDGVKAGKNKELKIKD